MLNAATTSMRFAASTLFDRPFSQQPFERLLRAAVETQSESGLCDRRVPVSSLDRPGTRRPAASSRPVAFIPRPFPVRGRPCTTAGFSPGYVWIKRISRATTSVTVGDGENGTTGRPLGIRSTQARPVGGPACRFSPSGGPFTAGVFDLIGREPDRHCRSAHR